MLVDGRRYVQELIRASLSHPYHQRPILAHLCFQRRDSEIGESCPALVALDVTLMRGDDHVRRVNTCPPQRVIWPVEPPADRSATR
jgi:hypothetical protein